MILGRMVRRLSDIDPNSIDAGADEIIKACLVGSPQKSFFLYAGAGSGKTRSLVSALMALREQRGPQLWMRGQRIGVITYTNKAADEIKRRLDYNALIEVSTIHSFAWTLLQGHTNDIRTWLEANLKAEIQELESLQARGRAGTKAAREREVSIASKRKRLTSLPSIQKFIYSPTENKRGRGALAHSEVIGCVSALLISKPSLQKILVSRFPVLLIDESQDTNKHLMDSLLEVQLRQSRVFVVGLFGDTMQRIYADGKAGLDVAIPGTWAKPAKVMNHRSRERIVRLVNRIRAAVDTQVQQSRSDKSGGFVRLFVFGSAGQDKAQAEALAASRMATIAGDEEWNRREARQTLILEHHMAAARLGFSDLYQPLYDVDQFRTGLLDGSLPALRFLTEEVLPFRKASREQKQFEAMAVLRRYSPLLSAEALKKAGKQQVAHIEAVRKAAQELLGLWDAGSDPSIETVVVTIAKSGLFEIPDALQPLVESAEMVAIADIEETDEPESRDEFTAAWSAASKVPFSQLEFYAEYVAGLSAFDTHQGVKGLQFKRVMVIIDDDAARGFMFSYDRVLGVKPKSDSDRRNEAAGQDTTVDRTRRLLYVTCSRAEESLAIVAYSQSPQLVLQSVVREGLFDASEVEVH
jgi:DNA helicase-2/ATP-dependent DNA helicase PcrA